MMSKKWLIPDMYYPGDNVPGPVFGHEAVSVLNTSDENATIEITLYFEDREPMQLETYVVKARRTWHIRMDLAKGKDGTTVPKDTPYASMVESNVNVAVQYGRADARQVALAAITTMACPID